MWERGAMGMLASGSPRGSGFANPCCPLYHSICWPMQADNAPQRVSKNPIEAVLLLSPPVAGCRSLPSFPSSGTLGCHLRSSLALRTHGDLLREVQDHPGPQASSRWDGGNQTALNFWGETRWLLPPPSEKLRRSIRHWDPESTPMGGHWAWVTVPRGCSLYEGHMVTEFVCYFWLMEVNRTQNFVLSWWLFPSVTPSPWWFSLNEVTGWKPDKGRREEEHGALDEYGHEAVPTF